MNINSRVVRKEINPQTSDIYTKAVHLHACGGLIDAALTELKIDPPAFVIGHRERGALLAHVAALHIPCRSAWTVESGEKEGGGFILQPGYEREIKGEQVVIVLYEDMHERQQRALIHAVLEAGCAIVAYALVTRTTVLVGVALERVYVSLMMHATT